MICFCDEQVLKLATARRMLSQTGQMKMMRTWRSVIEIGVRERLGKWS